MSNAHYGSVADGEWTFNDNTTHQMIVFRKGSDFDSVKGDDAGPDNESGDWLVGSSEWGAVNERLLPKVLDIVNRYEREHGRIT
jgi:hypothetical protein